MANLKQLMFSPTETRHKRVENRVRLFIRDRVLSGQATKINVANKKKKENLFEGC